MVKSDNLKLLVSDGAFVKSIEQNKYLIIFDFKKTPKDQYVKITYVDDEPSTINFTLKNFSEITRQVKIFLSFNNLQKSTHKLTKYQKLDCYSTRPIANSSFIIGSKNQHNKDSVVILKLKINTK